MDTREVAQRLGTEPRILRQFLRSPQSTFQAVGSSSRYDFTDRDISMLEKRFREWASGRTTPRVAKPSSPSIPPRARTATTQQERDLAVWAEEGPVVLPDIRNPQVRARVRAEAAASVARLEEQLIAAGLHISQWGSKESE